MDKLRVLVICQEDPEWILGGMGMHIRELYRAMAKRADIEIDLLTTGPGEYVKKYMGYNKHVSNKLVCWKSSNPNNANLLISDIQLMKTLLQLVNEGHKWDIVHAHEWTSMQLAWAVRDSLKIPLVTTMHLCITKLREIAECETDFSDKKEPITDETLYLLQQEAHLITSSSETIVCSNAYKKIVKEMFMLDVIGKKLNVIYNGICTDIWNPLMGCGRVAKEYFKLPNLPIVLFVGRIADMKGIRIILNMIEKMKTDPGFCTVLCGEVNANTDDEKETWDVTKKIRSLEKKYPNRLKWVGFQHGNKLRDLYKASTAVIMPSLHEPFGIVALEAMAMKIPLICTEVDGLKEIVIDHDDNEYALIIPSNSDIALLDAIQYLLNNDDTRQELIQLGIERVKDFNWDIIANQTVNIYKKVIRRK